MRLIKVQNVYLQCVHEVYFCSQDFMAQFMSKCYGVKNCIFDHTAGHSRVMSDSELKVISIARFLRVWRLLTS